MKRVRDEIWAQRRFRQLLATIIIMAFVLGVLIVPVEARFGRITSLEEGLWWAVTTVTSVGYGDFVPVTMLGRLIGAILQIMGVALLGLLVGLMGGMISRRQEEIYWSREFDRFNEIDAHLRRIEKQLDYMVREHLPAREQKVVPSTGAASSAAEIITTESKKTDANV